MLRSRIVPSLLMQDGGLLKTVQFRGGKYVGDPINAVKIFNEKVDELCLFDIGAEERVTEPNFHLLEKIAREAAMPLCYGGGVKSVQDTIRLVSMGFEKVSLSSSAIDDPKYQSGSVCDRLSEHRRNVGCKKENYRKDIRFIRVMVLVNVMLIFWSYSRPLSHSALEKLLLILSIGTEPWQDMT